MLDNMRRINKALVGNLTHGRVMSGLWCTPDVGSGYVISSGIGFTNNGDAVVIDATLRGNVSEVGTRYIFIKHASSRRSDGLSSSIIGKSGVSELVYDDLGAANGQNIKWDDVVVDAPSASSATDDMILICTITSGTVSNYLYRAFGPTDPTFPQGTVFNNIKTTGNITCAGTATVSDAVVNDDISVAGTLTISSATGGLVVGTTSGYTGNLSYKDNVGATKNLTFTNGILTAV